MSESRRSSRISTKRRARKDDVDRPFSRALLARARKVAKTYRLVIGPDDEGSYIGRVVELPGVFADGKTPNECLRATFLAIETTVATMLEAGEKPPSPASAARRTEQINIRLTPEEKLLLGEQTGRSGYSGLSEFVRAVALEWCKGQPTATEPHGVK